MVRIIELLDVECALCHVTGVQFDQNICPYKSAILGFLQKLPFAFAQNIPYFHCWGSVAWLPWQHVNKQCYEHQWYDVFRMVQKEFCSWFKNLKILCGRQNFPLSSWAEETGNFSVIFCWLRPLTYIELDCGVLVFWFAKSVRLKDGVSTEKLGPSANGR